MRKDRVFDMLDNADDRIVDRLSVPALTEKEKERLLKMSKDKLDRMNNANNDMAEEVRGVEKYKKPRWTYFAAAAACIALVGGLVGGGVLLNRSSSSKNDKESNADSVKTTQPTTEAASDVTTEAIEYATSATEDTTEDATVEAGGNAGDDEEDVNYTSVAIDLMKAMNAVELASSGALTLDGNQPLASDSLYYKVTDGNVKGYNFSTMSNVRSILSDNFTGDFYDKHSYLVDGSEPFFKEGTDGLYARFAGRGSIYGWEEYSPEIISASEDKFVARAYYEIAGAVFKADMTIVKNGGKWRVDSTEETLDHEIDMNGNGGDQNVSYVQLCKDTIYNKWNDLYSSEGNAIVQFAFNDLDGDGSPEFLFKYGTGEASFRADVYSYRDGSINYISTIGGGHTSFGVDASTKKLVMIYGHMGYGEYDWYTMENGELKQIKNETFDYEYWGSNEQTTRKDILYASSGEIFSLADGSTITYLSTQSAIDVQPPTTEYDYFNLDIVDQLYSTAVYAAKNIPAE